MENNELELKAYVFAQYIGQKVVSVSGYEKSLQPVAGNLLDNLDDFESPVLQLRPLSSITDAEAIEVSKLNGWIEDKIGREKMVGYGKSDTMQLSKDYHLSIFAYQYLQQQSFALPVFFKGVQYSVERLEAENIITLKN